MNRYLQASYHMRLHRPVLPRRLLPLVLLTLVASFLLMGRVPFSAIQANTVHDSNAASKIAPHDDDPTHAPVRAVDLVPQIQQGAQSPQNDLAVNLPPAPPVAAESHQLDPNPSMQQHQSQIASDSLIQAQNVDHGETDRVIHPTLSNSTSESHTIQPPVQESVQSDEQLSASHDVVETAVDVSSAEIVDTESSTESTVEAEQRLSDVGSADQSQPATSIESPLAVSQHVSGPQVRAPEVDQSVVHDSAPEDTAAIHQAPNIGSQDILHLESEQPVSPVIVSEHISEPEAEQESVQSQVHQNTISAESVRPAEFEHEVDDVDVLKALPTPTSVSGPTERIDESDSEAQALVTHQQVESGEEHESSETLEQEGSTIASIEHPNVANVDETGSELITTEDAATSLVEASAHDNVEISDRMDHSEDLASNVAGPVVVDEARSGVMANTVEHSTDSEIEHAAGSTSQQVDDASVAIMQSSVAGVDHEEFSSDPQDLSQTTTGDEAVSGIVPEERVVDASGEDLEMTNESAGNSLRESSVDEQDQASSSGRSTQRRRRCPHILLFSAKHHGSTWFLDSVENCRFSKRAVAGSDFPFAKDVFEKTEPWRHAASPIYRATGLDVAEYLHGESSVKILASTLELNRPAVEELTREALKRRVPIVILRGDMEDSYLSMVKSGLGEKQVDVNLDDDELLDSEEYVRYSRDTSKYYEEVWMMLKMVGVRSFDILTFEEIRDLENIELQKGECFVRNCNFM